MKSKPPGTVWATPGLLRDSVTFNLRVVDTSMDRTAESEYD